LIPYDDIGQEELSLYSQVTRSNMRRCQVSVGQHTSSTDIVWHKGTYITKKIIAHP